MQLDIQKGGVSRLALSNNQEKIIAVVSTANFASIITEELIHAAGSRKAE